MFPCYGLEQLPGSRAPARHKGILSQTFLTPRKGGAGNKYCTMTLQCGKIFISVVVQMWQRQEGGVDLEKKDPESAVAAARPWPLPKGSPGKGAWAVLTWLRALRKKNSHERFLRGNTVLTRKERALAFLVCSRKWKILCLTGNSLLSVSPTLGTSWYV